MRRQLSDMAPRHRAHLEVGVALALLVVATVGRLAIEDPRPKVQAGRSALVTGDGAEIPPPHPAPPGRLGLAAAPSYSRGVPCYGQEARGAKHFRVFYAHLQGTPNRMSETRGALHADVSSTDAALNASANRTGGTRHLRLDTGADCALRIEQVTFPRAMNPTEIRQHLVASGGLVGDEKAIVYSDWAAPGSFCGWAEVYADDSSGPGNINNRGNAAAVTFVSCLNQGTTGHEVMHTLGGVQNSAPNASGNFHCVDEWDRMCYDDAGGADGQVSNGRTVTFDDCPSEADNRLFDCGGNDFFSAAPAPGSYLATHWNVANSDYWKRSDPPAWDTDGTSAPAQPAPLPAPEPQATPEATPTPRPTPAPTPTPPPPTGGVALPPGGFDGDPRTTARVDHAEPASAAIEIARSRFDAAGGGRTAAHAVLSRDDTFPDSLAGAALTGDGPLLLTGRTALSGQVAAELRRVLAPGATVYLLGGESALSPQVADAVAAAGYRPLRLAGASRVETALAVADEVRRLHPAERRVALARAFGSADSPTAAWADAVSGGAAAAAAGIPILVVPTEGLPALVADWLAAARPTRTYLFGGTAALSPAVEAAAPNAQRISGADRAGTAVEVARTLWAGQTDQVVLFNASRDDGWAFGLSAAGLAADAGAPVLVLGAEVPAATADLLRRCDTPQVDALLVGATSVIGDGVRDQLDQLDGSPC